MAIKIGRKATRVIERNKKFMINTGHQPYPFVVASGDGEYAYDIEGNRFIDFTSFISVYNIGVNANAEVRSAVKKQADELMHGAFLDFYSEKPVKFAENLLTMFPKGFGRIFFSNSGTEANEAAIKLSRIFTKRQYIISFTGAFHGRTMGSLGLTDSKVVAKKYFGPFNSVIHAPFPYTYRSPVGEDEHATSRYCIDYLRDNILGHDVAPEEAAAIFIEPVQGEGGYVVPPREFMKELRELCTEHGILLVSDEVQAGYMRTGKFLAMDNFGVEADIYTMAKAIGGGLPMGATVTRRSLGDIPDGAHANTFGGNLAVIAAASASLDYVKRNIKSLELGVKFKNRIIMKRLERMKKDYEIIGDVRGLGLMIGVEFVKDRRTKENAAEERKQIVIDAFKNGLLLLPCGKSTIRIIPPVTMSNSSIEEGMGIFEDAVKTADAKAKKH